MKRFFIDLKNILYTEGKVEKGMSMFRVIAAVSFIFLLIISVADFICTQTFTHYNEYILFVGSMVSLSAGNKVIDKWGGHNE